MLHPATTPTATTTTTKDIGLVVGIGANGCDAVMSVQEISYVPKMKGTESIFLKSSLFFVYVESIGCSSQRVTITVVTMLTVAQASVSRSGQPCYSCSGLCTGITDVFGPNRGRIRVDWDRIGAE